jgi:RNA polymerase sigma factor (TIGR02999 family)
MAAGVTQLLLEWNQGSEPARKQLISLLYRELRTLAARSLKSERRDHTLQPTALVHEAYQKLVDQSRVQWQGRGHFFAVAAGLMRRILVDHARRRSAQRRGGDAQKVPITRDILPADAGSGADLVAIDEALTELAALDPEQARIVELRFFAGLTAQEAAEALGISRATINREWAVARAWLHRRLGA